MTTSPPPTLPPGAPYSRHDIIGGSLYQYPSTAARHAPVASTITLQRALSPNPAPSHHSDHVLRFTNCRVVRGHKLVAEDVWVSRGQVVDPARRFWDASQMNEFAADQTVDCRGRILAPGYIDIQINGALGFDFTLPSAAGWGEKAEMKETDGLENGGAAAAYDPAVIKAGLDMVARALLRHGVTAFCPTVITSSPATYAALLPHYPQRKGSPALGAHVLGLHCEGPFITKKGAHTEHLMRTGEVEERCLVEMYGEENMPRVSIITTAPEISGMLAALDYTKRRFPHVVLSSGHSSASFDAAYAATQHGVTLLTHLFNAMVPFTHRDPGIIGLIGSNDAALLSSLRYSIITDDIHTHAASVKIAYNSHPAGIVVITDAMAAMGLPSGEHTHIGKQAVTVVDGPGGRRRAVVRGTEVLAGSIATMDQCVREMRRATGCGVVEAVEAGSLHPAQVLGLDRKGRLDVGCDADILLLDDDLTLQGVWIGGEKAWVADGAVTIKEE